VGTHNYLKPSISNMSETPLQYWRHAATLGEHNEEIYKGLLGYSDAEYQQFIDDGHVGTAFLTNQRGNSSDAPARAAQ